MENYSRWLPTREATAYLGVSSQFLKKNRDIKLSFERIESVLLESMQIMDKKLKLENIFKEKK